MLTVVETPTFQRHWPNYWSEEERGEFCAYIAENPEAGDVVAHQEVFAKFAGPERGQASLAAFG